MPDSPVHGWTRAQRRLHWWSAALILAGFALAWVMVAVPFSALLAKFLLYQAHKTIGLAVFALILWRLFLRARRGRPGWEDDLPRWQARAAAAAHTALYALALAVPVLGYLTAATAPAQVPTLFLLVIPVPHLLPPDPAAYAVLRPIHRAAAILLVALALGHAAMAVAHHLRGRPTLRRMWRGGAGVATILGVCYLAHAPLGG